MSNIHGNQIKEQCLERSSHLRPPISDPPSQTPHLRPPSQATISGPPPHTLHLRPPISGPKPSSSDPTLFEGDYNIRPRQCRLLSFSHETTKSGPEHYTYNLRPQVFRMRLQYEAPTMSVVTFFARDYNIRPRT